MIPLARPAPARRKIIAALGGTYLNLTGASGSYASTPDSAAMSFVGSRDVRVKAALADWTPASGADLLFGQWGASFSLQAWLLYVDGAGKLNYAFVSTAAAFFGYASTVATGVADGTVSWVRVTHDTAAGQVVFYLSGDGVTWTQLGSAVAATTASVHDTSNVFEVGSSDSGTTNLTTGKIYKAELYQGIAGTLRAAPDFAAQAAGTTSFTDAPGNTWTVHAPASITT